MQTTKNRKFPPVGNSLLYISLLSVAFGRVRPQGAPCFLFYINGLVCCVSRSVVARDPAKHYKVAHGIAANAVAAMHTAGRFASGIQTGDRISLRIKNLCVCVDLQATHGMMDARCDFDCVIGCSRQVSIHTVVAAKLIRINRITISAGVSGLLLSFCSAAVSCIMPQKASFSKTFCHKLPDFT